MSKARKSLMALMILVGTCVAPMAALQSMGQEMTDENGNVVEQNTAQSSSKKGGGFVDIVFGSGVVGMLLWFALFGDGALAIYFCVDCYILIKPEKLMPNRLIDQVQKAMSEGDIVAAMEACQNTLMQRLTWISVCSNLGPSLGLLGTVQGMILTFQALAQGGAGDAAALASSIGQALWTTAGGLIVSIPSITAFYSLRNNANRLILRMTAVTMEFLNGLRNVEVAPEDGATEMA